MSIESGGGGFHNIEPLGGFQEGCDIPIFTPPVTGPLTFSGNEQRPRRIEKFEPSEVLSSPANEATGPRETSNISPASPVKEVARSTEVTQEFRDHMTFKNPVPNPLERDFFTKQLQVLGAKNPKDTRNIIHRIRTSYKSDNRFYHKERHLEMVGQPDVPTSLETRLTTFTKEEVEAMFVWAGTRHDEAYKHVDGADETGERAWSPELEEAIDGMAIHKRTVDNGKPIFTTYLTESGKKDGITRMVAEIFGVGKDGIIHNKGGNEFDSALAAAKDLAKQEGVKPEFIIATTAMIAGTIPFRKSVGRNEKGEIISDGDKGELAQKVRTVRLQFNNKTYQLTTDQLNDTMMAAVHLANRDVGPLLQPDNVAMVVKGGRDVRNEENRQLREGVNTIGELVAVATVEASAPLLYGWIADEEDTPVNAADVPSIYFPRDSEGNIIEGSESYPPREVYEAAKYYCKENCDGAYLLFKRHRDGISLTAAIATLVDEPNAPVPGFVDSKLWHSKALPQGGKLSESRQQIYEELMYGIHQVDVDAAVPKRSPISAVIEGALDEEKSAEVSLSTQTIYDENKDIPNPFVNRTIAQNYFDRVEALIGKENMRTILTELHSVAIHYKYNDRADKLKALAEGGRLQEYETK